MIIFTNDLGSKIWYVDPQIMFRSHMLFVSVLKFYSVLLSTVLPNNHANQAYGVLCPILVPYLPLWIWFLIMRRCTENLIDWLKGWGPVLNTVGHSVGYPWDVRRISRELSRDVGFIYLTRFFAWYAPAIQLSGFNSQAIHKYIPLGLFSDWWPCVHCCMWRCGDVCWYSYLE